MWPHYRNRTEQFEERFEDLLQYVIQDNKLLMVLRQWYGRKRLGKQDQYR